jgi:outer membrane protein assembly factor BamB
MAASALVATASAVAAAPQPAGTPKAAGSSTAAAGWLTYQHDPARSGVSADQQPLGDVQRLWTSVPLDGAVYAQPLVAGERVIVATEGGTVYALEAATGDVAWRSPLGAPVPGSRLPCGNIDPSGITGTPVIDPASGRVYVVAFLGDAYEGLRHELFVLDGADGRQLAHRRVDPPGLEPEVEQQRGALALAGGRVYVPYGGLNGDCGAYRGAVVSVPADGGSLESWIVPTRRMGGIWNPGGAAVGPGGDLWVTTGNSTSERDFDFGNAVVRLTPALQVRDWFAPSDWRDRNRYDADLGSTAPILMPGVEAGDGGRVLATGKLGTVYLLDARALGHVGGELAHLDVGAGSYGAAAVLDSVAFVPCTDALVAVRTSGGRLAILWRHDGRAGPPIVAAGAVWCLENFSRLVALDLSTGKELFSAELSRAVSRFICPSAAGGSLFLPDRDRILALALLSAARRRAGPRVRPRPRPPDGALVSASE